MHAISSYRGNRPTNTHTHTHTHKPRQDRSQYTVLLSLARSVNIIINAVKMFHLWFLLLFTAHHKTDCYVHCNLEYFMQAEQIGDWTVPETPRSVQEYFFYRITCTFCKVVQYLLTCTFRKVEQ